MNAGYVNTACLGHAGGLRKMNSIPKQIRILVVLEKRTQPTHHRECEKCRRRNTGHRNPLDLLWGKGIRKGFPKLLSTTGITEVIHLPL